MAHSIHASYLYSSPIPLTEDPEGPGPILDIAHTSLICSRSEVANQFVLEVIQGCEWCPFSVFRKRWYRIGVIYCYYVW